jgi:hypothetical protein
LKEFSWFLKLSLKTLEPKNFKNKKEISNTSNFYCWAVLYFFIGLLGLGFKRLYEIPLKFYFYFKKLSSTNPSKVSKNCKK